MYLCEGTSIFHIVCMGHFLPSVPLISEFLRDPITSPLSSPDSAHQDIVSTSFNFFPFGPSERWVQPPVKFLQSRRSRSHIFSPMQPLRVPLHLLHTFSYNSH